MLRVCGISDSFEKPREAMHAAAILPWTGACPCYAAGIPRGTGRQYVLERHEVVPVITEVIDVLRGARFRDRLPVEVL